MNLGILVSTSARGIEDKEPTYLAEMKPINQATQQSKLPLLQGLVVSCISWNIDPHASREQENMQSRENASWLKRRQAANSSGQMGNLRNRFQGVSRPSNIGNEQTTHYGTMVTPITWHETVV
jgi:hypothetical protein